MSTDKSPTQRVEDATGTASHASMVNPHCLVVPVTFARELATELERAQAEREAYKRDLEIVTSCHKSAEDELVVAQAENAALRQRIDDPFIHESPTTKFHEWLAKHGLESCKIGTYDELVALREDKAMLDWLLAGNASRTTWHSGANSGGVAIQTFPDRAAIRAAMKQTEGKR